MRHAVVVICLALVVAGAAVASPGEASQKAAWTQLKAERQVQNGATIRLAAEDRAALEEELRRGMVLNQALAVEDLLTGYGAGEVGASVYLERAHQYSQALSKVRRGLAVESAACSGSGAAVRDHRFSTFRCSVTSESLELPPGNLAGTAEVLPSTQAGAGGWSGPVSPASGIPMSAGIPEAGMPYIAGEGEPLSERQSRIIGPIVVELEVRVTGTSSFSYQAL